MGVALMLIHGHTIRLLPHHRWLFTSPLRVDHWAQQSAHWAAIIVLLGVTVLSGWQIIAWHKPECSRYDIRRDVGIDERGKLCKRRPG